MNFKTIFRTLAMFAIFVTQVAHAQFYFEKDTEEYLENKVVGFYTPSRYNRVEGLFLAPGLKIYPRSTPELKLWVDGGYGFENKKWRYRFGLERTFFRFNRLKLGFTVFDRTASNEEWIIREWENSLAALFFREDFKDYFGQKGWMGYLNQKFADVHNFRIEYSSLNYRGMRKQTDWSLLGGHKKFRDNPSVTEGRETKIRAMVALDFLDNPIYPTSGWYFEGIFEKAGGRLRGDFDFVGVFLTAKRYQKSFGNQRFVFQARLGSRKGTLAEQHLIDVGGIGTLRGYRYKEFTGNRMLLFNLDYFFGGDVLRRIPLNRIPFYNAFTLIFFIDAGWAWLADKDAGLLRTFGLRSFGIDRLKDLKANMGLSLSTYGDFLRVDFAKRLDRRDRTWRITLRILPKL